MVESNLLHKYRAFRKSITESNKLGSALLIYIGYPSSFRVSVSALSIVSLRIVIL
jgi:hypothetical protein